MSELAAEAYSYGCPASFDLDDAVREQLFLASRLWNRLVEIHHGHEAAKAAIWVTDPDVAAAQRRADAAREAVTAAYEQIRRSRSEDRTTVPRAADKAVLDAAAGRLAGCEADLDAAREAALPGLRTAFAAARKARQDAVRATYPEFAGLGLGWGTWNDIARPVSGRFDRAVAKLEKDRAAGRPADLRFRRFDGTGTLVVQLQRAGTVTAAEISRLAVLAAQGVKAGDAAEILAAEGFPVRSPMSTGRMLRAAAAGTARPQRGDPPRSPALLASGGGKWRNVAQLSPWADPAGGRPKGEARHGTMRLVIGRSREHGPLTAEIPVVLDRYLPADADVCEVRLTRFRQGARYRCRVSAGFRQPAAAAAVPAGGQVAVRLSWRAAGDGWVTVAHAASPAVPFPPLPASLAGLVRVSADGRSAEVLCSPLWRRLLDRDDGIRAIRDQNADVIRQKVTAALRDDPGLGERAGVTAGDAARWNAPRRFAALARRWPQDHPLAAVLEEWRKRDRHLLEFEGHERAQVLASRRDAYRCAAKWLCGAASGLVIDGSDLAEAKRAPGDDREDPEGARGSRRLLHSAAPGELRAAVEAAAARRGIPVTVVRTGRKQG